MRTVMQGLAVALVLAATLPAVRADGPGDAEAAVQGKLRASPRDGRPGPLPDDRQRHAGGAWEDGRAYDGRGDDREAWRDGHGWDRGAPAARAELRCASRDGRAAECRLPFPGRVMLARQDSRSACVRGHSWDVYRGSLWVYNGCRGRFLVEGRERGHRY